ncbi:MAG: lipid II flippase MurJ, partial [Dolichospermum sp.]
MAIHGSAKAQNFAGKILSVLVATLTILSIFALWQMPLVIELLAPGFSNDPNKYALTIELTRITFPYLLLVSTVTLLSGVLNAHNRFASAAAAPILLNVSVVVFVGFTFLFPSAGHAAAWGVTIAGIFEILILLVNARRAGCLPKFQWPIPDTSLRGFFRSLGPAVVSSGGIQISMFADTILASLMPTGSVSAIYYADRIYQLPVGI